MAFLLLVTGLFTVVTTAGSPTFEQEAVRAGEVEPGSHRTGCEPDVVPGRGGHSHVLYGYDTSRDWVYWGDPGPAKRYNWSTYGYYTHNSSFTWTHTLTGIAR